MTKQQLLQDTDLFLLDLDGTVYLDETPIGDVKNTLARLRACGKKLVYLTNNSSKTPEEYVGKLRRIGLWEEGDGVYTSAMAAIEYLSVHYEGARVHVLATDAVRAQFGREGVILDDVSPEVCVLAYDVTIDFAKMKRFNEFLAGGAVYIATHPDDVCPTAGVPMPDVGSFIALFGRSCGRMPSVVCGKPYTVMGECVARAFGVPAARTCMVGDRMHTDIRFGNANGMHTLLVLSGETTAENMKNFPDRPDLVLKSLDEIF